MNLTKAQENALYAIGTGEPKTLRELGSTGQSLVKRGLLEQDFRGRGSELPLRLTAAGKREFKARHES